MKPVSPVIPNENFPEIVVAEDQPEYLPLPAVRLDGGVLLTRWQLDEDERQKVAETGDIYVFMMTFGQPVMPLSMQTETPQLEVQPFLLAALRKTPERVKQAENIGVEILTGTCAYCAAEVIAAQSSFREKTTQGAPIKLICLECFNESVGTLSAVPLAGSDDDYEKVTEHLKKQNS